MYDEGSPGAGSPRLLHECLTMGNGVCPSHRSALASACEAPPARLTACGGGSGSLLARPWWVFLWGIHGRVWTSQRRPTGRTSTDCRQTWKSISVDLLDLPMQLFFGTARKTVGWHQKRFPHNLNCPRSSMRCVNLRGRERVFPPSPHKKTHPSTCESVSSPSAHGQGNATSTETAPL